MTTATSFVAAEVLGTGGLLTVIADFGSFCRSVATCPESLCDFVRAVVAVEYPKHVKITFLQE